MGCPREGINEVMLSYDTLHVLIIEDDDDTRSNLRDILELDDYRIEMAGTAAEALALNCWSSIQMVILDRKLPDSSAEQLLPHIKRLAPQAAVIVVTGYADLDSTIAAVRLGAYDYLLKPINADALRASLVRYVELREAQRRAMQSERLAAIGQMIAGLAHESRNALQRAQACLEMLKLEVEDRPAALQLAQRVEQAQDDLARLYEEVRSYAAPINLDRHPCDLADLWRHIWKELQPVRRDRCLTLNEQLDADRVPCNVDAFALGQVFRNIFENAAFACPAANGRIVVRCGGTELHGQYYLRIAIRDNGPGIPPKARARIFEPFYTTKTKGTGLGLAIAKRIVEAHGGELQVSDEGDGAEFVILLPCHERASTLVAPSS